ncbi:hypothetical protein [Myxococcus qinghaiensis]|uniref:hypothetical protein n=1 Tax=Myxococcus qinghaiensis TaxID=2906758 RepID=UPI0020A71AB4|nr:hypothetical protein [Myxococcus qinghaiensis]MCP3168534.1 hypothetical protein [Myxococcus qinghaiensis]
MRHVHGAVVVGCLTALLTALPAHASSEGDLEVYTWPVLLLILLEVWWPVLVAAMVLLVAPVVLWRVWRRRASRRAPVRARMVRPSK